MWLFRVHVSNPSLLEAYENNPSLFETQTSVNLDDSESVPENQPEAIAPTGTKKSARRKSHKAKGDKSITRATRSIQKWILEEESLLASAWVDVSEHTIVGSEQTKDAMWDRIEEKFFAAMDKDASYRTRDQLTYKWGHINRKVRKFIGVYEECSRS
ncbi:unnamed protein product [Cuscuta campestris]|uniref:Myb/SANT-like domain-containing protein n=1 Tax=Cuscuta campestris TaxID=132261 RepID=A0A484KQ37_9ASTE|nr:unnamed protein product [Cuscuta campestris]